MQRLTYLLSNEMHGARNLTHSIVALWRHPPGPTAYNTLMTLLTNATAPSFLEALQAGLSNGLLKMWQGIDKDMKKRRQCYKGFLNRQI